MKPINAYLFSYLFTQKGTTSDYLTITSFILVNLIVQIHHKII